VISEDLVEKARGGATPPTDALSCLRAAVVISEELRAEADDLVGYFVDEARRAGHSWTEIGGSLGVTKQAVRKRFGSSVGFPLQSRLQRCLDQAAEEAKLDGSSEVSSLHLLLGLLREGVASVAMEHLGVTDDRLRSAVSATQGSVSEPGKSHPPLSEEAKDAIDCAIGLCREHGGTLVGTEHLFFVLATEVGSRTRKLLEGMGVSLADVKRELACFIEPVAHTRWSRRRRDRQRRSAAQ
jgi:hypothetical protein